MRILMISTNDPAGMGIAFTKAINRYTEHQCRLVTTAERYGFAYETDLHVPDLGPEGFEIIDHLLREADLIHFHILADEHIELGPIRVRDYIQGKRIVHHHHGHPHFRANPGLYRDKYKKLGRRVLVSTPDLLQLLPEAAWMPNLVELDDPLLLPRPEPLSPPVVVGHSPTRKELKNTEELKEAVASLHSRRDLPELRLMVIENTPHRACLEQKRASHIVFDHMQGYYGVSSLESLAQGRPVIAGLDDWNIGHIKEFTGTDFLPWTIARDTDSLTRAIAQLAKDSGLRQEQGKRARAFMERYWHPRRVVQRLTAWYGEV